jgi:chemotaxis protein methyltransferase CheR
VQPDSTSAGGARPVLTAQDHAMLRTLLHQRTGIRLEEGKEYFVEMRLCSLATDEGFASPADVLEVLRTEENWGVLHRRVAEALAIAETSWFRDVHPFDELRRSVLPQMLQKRAATRELRIWSAACASGQEPYSVAMLLREYFPQLISWHVQLLATDFSTTVLRRAREAVYSQIEVNRGLPAPMLVKWFRKDGLDWRLRDDARNAVEFRELNLTAPWPTVPTQDVVLMRNVLLYFDTAARRTVLRNVHRTLAPDGLLFLGGSETTLSIDDTFEPVTFGRTVAYRPRPGAV